MKRIIIFNIVYAWLIMSCSSNNKSLLPDNSFRFYDLFSLEGKEPLLGKVITYPFVVINNSHDTTLITHHFSAADSFIATYVRRRDIVERLIYNPEQPDRYKIKEFIRNDSVIVLDFSPDSNLFIEGIGVFSQNKFNYYTFPNPQKNENFTADSAINFITSIQVGQVQKIDFSKVGDSIAVSRIFEMLDNVPEPVVRRDTDTTTGRRIGAKQSYFFDKYNNMMEWLIYDWKYYNSSFFSTSSKLEELNRIQHRKGND
jgi:hypothetical protein